MQPCSARLIGSSAFFFLGGDLFGETAKQYTEFSTLARESSPTMSWVMPGVISEPLSILEFEHLLKGTVGTKLLQVLLGTHPHRPITISGTFVGLAPPLPQPLALAPQLPRPPGVRRRPALPKPGAAWPWPHEKRWLHFKVDHNLILGNGPMVI